MKPKKNNINKITSYEQFFLSGQIYEQKRDQF